MITSMILAHSRNNDGVGHSLSQHLQEVARLARERAEKFDAQELAHWAGLWHDIGKAHPKFQAYLREPEIAKGPDHKAAGAVLAVNCKLDPLAFLVKGHHGGLPSVERAQARKVGARIYTVIAIRYTL